MTMVGSIMTTKRIIKKILENIIWNSELGMKTTKSNSESINSFSGHSGSLSLIVKT